MIEEVERSLVLGAGRIKDALRPEQTKLFTMAEPELAQVAPGRYLMAQPNEGATGYSHKYFAHWYWIIGGRPYYAGFEVDPTKPDAAIRTMREAYEDLLKFVEKQLPARVAPNVGIQA